MNRAEARQIAHDHAAEATRLHQAWEQSHGDGKTAPQTRGHWRESIEVHGLLSTTWSQLALALPEAAEEDERCFSCDHLTAAHEAAGCVRLVVIDREAGSSQCACAVGTVGGKLP